MPAMHSPTETALCLDIGGSKLLVALVAGGRSIDRHVIATEREAGPDAWIDAAARAAAPWRDRYQHVAAAVTGNVAGGLWRTLNPHTLAFAEPFPLVDRLTNVFGRPAVALNDGHAAAWGEYRHGAGRGRDMVFMTVSTGLGGGIVAGGALWRGTHGVAGHFGLAPPDLLEGGGQDRFEDMCTGRWIAASAAGRLGADCQAREVFDAAAAGAGWADAIIATSARRIAVLCHAAQRMIDPAVIVIGGGIGLAPGFIDRIEAALDGAGSLPVPQLEAAALGADAGVVGAADLAMKTDRQTVHRKEKS